MGKFLISHLILYIYIYIYILESFNLWRPLLIITLYYQIKISIGFYCRNWTSDLLFNHQLVENSKSSTQSLDFFLFFYFLFSAKKVCLANLFIFCPWRLSKSSTETCLSCLNSTLYYNLLVLLNDTDHSLLENKYILCYCF